MGYWLLVVGCWLWVVGAGFPRPIPIRLPRVLGLKPRPVLPSYQVLLALQGAPVLSSYKVRLSAARGLDAFGGAGSRRLRTALC